MLLVTSKLLTIAKLRKLEVEIKKKNCSTFTFDFLAQFL